MEPVRNRLHRRLRAIADAVRALPADNALIDGEAVVFRPDGHSDFAALRTRAGGEQAAFVAFDLLSLEADDLRQRPLEERREALAQLVAGADAIRFSEAVAAEGALVFDYACKLGLEGIVSKRAGSRYRSGPSRNWLKVLNPEFAARERPRAYARRTFAPNALDRMRSLRPARLRSVGMSDIVEMLENDTRNQHFVTQGEQRLNAMNPQADPRNQRIYSFEVVDRENYTLALESPIGRPIGNNLSLFDLFSFDVPGDSRLRLNFESLFQKYEGYIEDHTLSLLAKLNAGSGDIKAEIIDLFAAKLLNFVRNPFSIVKVLNSFPGLASYDPTDPALLADYRRVVSGRKPHQAHLCARARYQRRAVCRMVARAVHAAGANGRGAAEFLRRYDQAPA